MKAQLATTEAMLCSLIVLIVIAMMSQSAYSSSSIIKDSILKQSGALYDLAIASYLNYSFSSCILQQNTACINSYLSVFAKYEKVGSLSFSTSDVFVPYGNMSCMSMSRACFPTQNKGNYSLECFTAC